jgi:hypothetical protein
MLALQRETMIEQLLKLSNVAGSYAQKDPEFVAKLDHWLDQTQEKLKPLRSPIAGRVSSQRALLNSVEDGYRHPQVESSGRSYRKHQRAMGVLVLEEIEETLRHKVDSIDQELDILKEKVAQLLAIVSQREPIQIPEHLTPEALDRVWAQLGGYDETRSMYLYIQAKTDRSDRQYLLSEMISQMVS